jgi:hypothetical protein
LAVVGFDPLEVEAYKFRRGEFLGQDGAVDVGDRCLLKMKAPHGGERPQSERDYEHRGTKRFLAHSWVLQIHRYAGIVAKVGAAYKG